ncbi:unnamed protein product [Penicillium salamii]|nr:unnamed protein product [Penicillium salamii]CAG8166864.1 unnamed protein product [Penicillium salamii]CAG8249695.1 unnamed protein product [Penicillium salamii]
MDKDALAHWEKTRTFAQWKYSQADTNPPNPDMRQLASVYIDSMIRFVIPLCSMMADRPEPSNPITSSLYLVDATDFGLKRAWGIRTFAQEISWLLNTCYPETVEKIFVCNSPSYFQSIWKYLKGYVDPHTADKIVFLLPGEVLPTLREVIDDINIPAKFGGGLAFTHGQSPDLENDIKQHLGLDDPSNTLPPGPIKWIEELDGRRTALAVGSQGGAERSDRFATIDVPASNISAQALSVEA